VNKLRATILVTAVLILIGGLWAQNKAPLALKQTIPVPGITKEGDFDHLAVDVQGNRLFIMGEDNSVVEIIDLGTNKLIHTISDVKAPHSAVYRGDLKKLFVVDGGAGEVKIYDSVSLQTGGKYKVARRCRFHDLRSFDQIHVRREWRQRRPYDVLFCQRG
jgi:DNA-binding beta-propeller fold protein YncE